MEERPGPFAVKERCLSDSRPGSNGGDSREQGRRERCERDPRCCRHSKHARPIVETQSDYPRPGPQVPLYVRNPKITALPDFAKRDKLTQRIAQLEAELARYQELAPLLQSTLISAERAADTTR